MNKQFYHLLFLLFLWCFSGTFIKAQELPGIADKDYSAYLFVYFTGNNSSEESVHYAISQDGYLYYALNNNMPILDSKIISSTGGVRDPHILRSEDGKNFYMVLTDMVSANGWSSNRGMVLLKSNDLIHWNASMINIQKKYPNQENLLRVWAPQTVYDNKTGKYMIYWSMKHGNGGDIIYYAYANKEFTDLEGEPKQLFFPKSGTSCIDGDIILKDGLYHLFYKTEGMGNGIKLATGKSLTSGCWEEYPDYLQQTSDAVEGSSVFKLNHSDEYILMYDVYMKGKYQFTKSQDLKHFSVIDQEVTMDFHPRHGTIIPVTRKELKKLLVQWGKPKEFPEVAERNPVLEGYYADPEILYAKQTGKYYIYPTSDGFKGWSGTSFKVFSSDNLTDWKDEGIILDLKKDVTWADRNAWAPCIIEKKIKKNKYKYYYYFTAAQKIGVAAADAPCGPFTDSGKPLVAQKPEGVKNGQEIDPDVFTDPKSRKSYLYWGNGYLAVAELNKDMISLCPGTTKIITPDKTFREGTYVFYRKGIYYFLWSEGDTRSADYRVRYGTSQSPSGPISIPENNLVIAKQPEKGIYATGHCSVIQKPNSDEWFIVYHRFDRFNGREMGRDAGFHREVCIDPLRFNTDGTIIQTIPSL